MMLVLELLLLLQLALAAPHIAFPVNAQVPPVGRVGDAFSFIMAPFTFQDDASPSTIPTYSVSDTPSWLQFAPNTRAFSGTPESSDVGAFVFNLTAISASGSTSAPVTFIVSDKPEISIQESFASQAGQLGLPVNGNEGVIVKAATPFNFSFSPNTFSHSSTISMYYAVSGDNSPLPSWISFDEKTLSFAGTAPSITSLIAPPQYFPFSLIASDYVGFTGGIFPFSIVIGSHTLELHETMFTKTAKDGENFKFTLPLSSILLDSQPITSTSIASVTANVTNWLGFDNSTITLSGIPMSKNDSTVVSISITDVFRDTVTARVAVDVDGNMPHVYNTTNTTDSTNSSSVSNSSLSTNGSESLFTSTIPNVNATQGGFFLYTINSTYLKSDNIVLKPSYDPADKAGWITFNPSNNSFSGNPTDDWTTITVTLTASMSGIQKRDIPQANTTSFAIHSVVSGPHGTRPASSAPSSANSNGTSGSNKNRTIGIIVGSVLGAAILLVLLILLIWCCRRRRRERKAISPSRSYSPHDAISRPLPNAPEMQAWPVMDEKWDEPRRLSALKIFKRNSGLSGFVAEVPSPNRERGITPTTSQPAMALAVDTHLANNGPPKLILPLTTPSGPPGYGQPRKSWRAKGGAERDWFDTNRNSEASLATVSTNEIFSVRLVDSPKDDLDMGSIMSPNNPFRSTMASQPSSIAPTVVPIFEHPPMPHSKMPNIEFPISDSRMTIGSYSSSDENYPVQLGPEINESPSENSDLYSTTEGSSPRDTDYLYDDGSSGSNQRNQRQGNLGAHEGKWFGGSSESFESARNARIGTAQVARSPMASPQAKLVEFTKRRPVSSEERSPNFGSEAGEMLADNDNDPVFL